MFTRSKVTFTVSSTPDEYAPEELLLGAATVPAGGNPSQPATAILEFIDKLSAAKTAVDTATDATVELWFLKVGGDPATAGDWLVGPVLSTATPIDVLPDNGFGPWPGFKYRCKSGGTAGTVEVSVVHHSAQ